MESDNSEIEVAIPYSEYNALQKQLNHVSTQNIRLNAQLKQMKQHWQMEKEKKKELESMIRALSKNSLKNSKKIIDLEEEKQRANQQILELKKSILQLQNTISEERALKEESLSKIETLIQRNHHFKDTIAAMQNRLSLKEQQVYQLNIQYSQKSKSLRKLSQKCTEIQSNLQQMKIKQRIIVDDGEADYHEMKEEISQLEDINKKLKIQNAELIEKLAHMSPIVSEYQKSKAHPQIAIIQAYKQYLQNYKQKLTQASLNIQETIDQLQAKRTAIECSLSRSFQQIVEGILNE